MIDHRLAAAVRENAAWVDLVCRGRGLPTAFTPERWHTTRRSPPFYPDAETLRPGVTAAVVLAGVDTGPGCSVKDSFADLDLAPLGFTVLFSATWIWRPAGPGSEPVTWWATRSPIVADPSVTAFGGPDGSVVAHLDGDVVGLSNLTGRWEPAVAAIATAFPDRPIVGYDRDPAAASECGFTPLGPLRVWGR
ncbi:MAG TPA: hypothetical protein VN408_39350 [Actinoplanes sp.]|nr:hypothetical protein [Actinoplanes sp.]